MTPGTSFPRVRSARPIAFTPGKWVQVLVRLVPAAAVLMVFGFLARGRFRSIDALTWADAAAFGLLLLGGVLTSVRKGRTFHRTAGWVWVGLVSLVAGSSLFITSLNHGRWSLLHLVTGWTLIILPLAVVWAKRHEVARHRRAMMGLFYGGFAINLFVAFIPGRTLWTMILG